MKIGDLVRHKYHGGVGIIIERPDRWVGLGDVEAPLVRWLEQPMPNYVRENIYHTNFLEPLNQTVKN